MQSKYGRRITVRLNDRAFGILGLLGYVDNNGQLIKGKNISKLINNCVGISFKDASNLTTEELEDKLLHLEIIQNNQKVIELKEEIEKISFTTGEMVKKRQILRKRHEGGRIEP